MKLYAMSSFARPKAGVAAGEDATSSTVRAGAHDAARTIDRTAIGAKSCRCRVEAGRNPFTSILSCLIDRSIAVSDLGHHQQERAAAVFRITP
jgi:hypothetical protein